VQRPAEPAGELWVHPVEYAGSTVQNKVGAMQQQMREVGATLLLTSLLDEVAWLLNVVSAHSPPRNGSRHQYLLTLAGRSSKEPGHRKPHF